jgi:SAM-dependent methyltransferase
MLLMNLNSCPVCNNQLKLKYKLRFNVYKCLKCHLYISDASFDYSFVSDIDEDARVAGLEKLRITNFNTILSEIKHIYGANYTELKGLEIGCGNGWWLKTCRENGITCAGIEPEKSFENSHQKNGFEVTYGLYPQTKNTAKYDFIIFNDVFEHIPDVNDLMRSLNSDLNEGGYLIINIPLSDGFFSTCARALNKVGIKGFLNRMWQFDFHSPHYTYFNAENLNQLASTYSFTKTNEFKLSSLDFGSIKERIITDKKFNKVIANILGALLMCLKPVINTAKPDVKVFFFKKQATNQA